VDAVPASAYVAVGTLSLGAALLVPRLVQLFTRLVRPLLAKLAGLEAQLANQNLPRNLLRTSATAGALMMGIGSALGFSIFVGSFKSSMAEWAEQSLPADLWVTSGARFGSVRNTLMTEALGSELAKIAGLDAVEPARLDDIGYRGFPIKLVATATAIYASRSRISMLSGTQASATAALGRGEVLVSENFGRRFHVGRGDSIELSTKRGTTRFRVAGVHVDYTSDVGTVLMDRATYLRHWDDARVSVYKLYLHKGTEIEAVRASIQKRHGDRYDLFVLTNREIRAQVLDLLDRTFSVMHALEVVGLVIAVLGVVNALLASVFDRVREIGVLRALGMLSSQAKKMIVVEGVLIACVGILGGLGLGFALGDLVLNHVNTAQTGWRFPYRPAWTWTAEMVVFCVVASALAAWYPATRSAAIRIVSALGYE
jgi:putative ABC transport system permease protein